MNSSKRDPNDNPDVKFPPPLMVLGWWLVGYFIHLNVPVEIVSKEVSLWGWLVCWLVGFCLLSCCIAKFKKAKTRVEPWRETTTIISTGIYAFSRNPIYLGFLIVSVGGALGVNSLWILLSVIPSILTLQRYVIFREEQYLERKFGTEYTSYKQNVRRWL